MRGVVQAQLHDSLGRLTALAAEATGAAASVVCLVSNGFGTLIGGSTGAESPLRAAGTSLALSLHELLAASGSVLVAEDTRDEPGLREHRAFDALGVRACFGISVEDAAGAILGSFWVLDFSPRGWSERDVRVLTGFAEAAASEIGRAGREHVLIANEARVRTLLNNVGAVCWETDARTFETVFVSQHADRLLGYPSEAWLEGPDFWVSLLHPDDRETAVATSRAAVAEGRAYAHEYRMLARDGRTVWIRDLVEVITREDGVVTSLQGIMFDITESKAAEQARDASEERYRALVEHAPNCTYLQAADFRVTYISPHVESMLGYGVNEWLDDPTLFARIVHPADRETVLAEVARCRASGGPFNMEYRVIARDGRIVWCYDATVPVRDGTGPARFRQGFLVDVTESKAVGEALIASEARYRALVEHSTDLIAVVAADGRYQFASQSHEQQVGYLPLDLVGTPALDLVHPDDVTHTAALFSAALDGAPPSPTLVRIRAADGQWLFIEGVAKRLESEGEPTALLIGRDVTARHAADQERELRTRQLQALASASVEMTAERNPKSIAQRAARLARELVGASAARVTIRGEGLSAPALRSTSPASVPEETFPSELAAHAVLLSAGGEQLGTIELAVEADGTAFTADDQALLVQLAQATSATLERAELESRLRQSQKMEAIGQLAGGVAHDFNNLLTVIGGYSEVALSSLADDACEARQAITEVKAAAERAGSLTRQLLAFSRKHVISPEVFPVGDVVAELTPMLARLIGENIDISYDASAAAAVRADRALLGQVIVNLATNARDAMPNGGTLTVTVDDVELSSPLDLDEARLAPGRYARLAVSDSGVGMNEATRQRATEPFFTTKAMGEGTGLGLATVHGIVGDSGGSLHIDSSPGTGTTVSVYFPAAEPVGEHTGIPATSAPVAVAGDTRVLVVEDEEVLRSLVVRMLSSQGYDVCATGSPRRAIAHVADDPPFDLLITDVVMPEISGPELVRCLGDACPPVLYTSGYAGDARAKHGLDGEEVAFLQKPFTLAALTERVSALLATPPARASVAG